MFKYSQHSQHHLMAAEAHQGALRQAVQRVKSHKLHGALREVQRVVLKRHLPCSLTRGRNAGEAGKTMENNGTCMENDEN